MRSRFAGAFARLLILAALAALGGRAQAHVDWTRANAPDLEILALYQFDGEEENPGEAILPAGDIPLDRSLMIGVPSGENFNAIHDTPEAIFDPHSFRMGSAQEAQTTATFTSLEGDLTVEFWLKWDSTATSSSLEIGLRSGAKLRISRDPAVPANDQFGIQATHGDYVEAPGFTSWADAGTEEAPFDEWLHVAVTIHSTGMHFDSGLGHDVYNAGSIARFWLNGHETGAAPHTLDIAGLQVHGASRIVIRNFGGRVFVDEVTIWKKDWSQNGAAVNPFGDGRGSGSSLPPLGVGNWKDY